MVSVDSLGRYPWNLATQWILPNPLTRNLLIDCIAFARFTHTPTGGHSKPAATWIAWRWRVLHTPPRTLHHASPDHAPAEKESTGSIRSLDPNLLWVTLSRGRRQQPA